MTAYHGGKQRIGKKIAKIIYEESLDIEDEFNFIIKGYCEPFCGMLGVYQHIPGLFEDHKPKLKYKAGDVNKSVIKMWQAAQKGWKPPKKVSKKEFEKLKYDNKASAIKGYVGHAYTYRGVFFDSYFKGAQSKITTNEKRVSKIAEELNNVSFSFGSYTRYSNLKGYVIYCDPPYEGTMSKYYEGTSDRKKLDFNHAEFWNWCRKMAKDNVVFVSSYKAPKDFECIFSSSHKLTGVSAGKNNNSKRRTEKLFIIF